MALEAIHGLVDLHDWSFSAFDWILLSTGFALFFALLCKVLVGRSRATRPPGPVGLPLLGYLPFLGLESHKTLWKLKKKYGDIIGLYLGGKYMVVLNEYNVTKETLTHPGALDRSENLFHHIPTSGFISKNGEEWLEQRRFCLSSTRDLGLGRSHWEDLMMDEVEDLNNILLKSGGEPFDIFHDLSSSLCSNIISLLIGRRLNKNGEAEIVKLSRDFSEVSFTFMGPSNPTSLIPGLWKILENFRIAGYHKAAQVIRRFCCFVKEEISRHKTTEDFRSIQDFMNIYLAKLAEMPASEKVKHYFSEKNLEGNVNILFLASTDTVFSSIGWIIRLMSKHKDIQEKVYTELMEVLGKDKPARYNERNNIPYTFAVMMESQRFSSIVPLSTTRCANQNFQIRGYTIPKGSDIVSNLWALHHDPNYWDEPDTFRPERFLTKDGTKLIKNPPSFAPFSIGRRNCPGETIAWMEIMTYFTEIVKKFEISTPLGVETQFEIVNGLVTHLEPQPLCFKERSD